MNFSALREIEHCALRWALRHADYGSLWSGNGYPPAPHGAAITGEVVHETIARVLHETAVSAGQALGPAHDGPTLLVDALRRLGGMSAVIDSVIAKAAVEWARNPRLRTRPGDLASGLVRQAPLLRARVQAFLSRIDLKRLAARPTPSPQGRSGARVRAAHPLAPGLHAEVPLVSDEIRWYGRADLLRVGVPGGEDEIIDYKTGLPKDDHAFQLRVYALLWAKDKQRNPSGRRAARLTLLYDANSVNVPAPVTEGELEEVARELRGRTERALTAANEMPPQPRPSPDACEWCDVRQMCSAYWTKAADRVLSSGADRGVLLVDVGVEIAQRQGAWSWVAVVREVGLLSRPVSADARVLLRADPHSDRVDPRIAAGERARILGGQYVAESAESGGLPVIRLTRSSEVFFYS